MKVLKISVVSILAIFLIYQINLFVARPYQKAAAKDTTHQEKVVNNKVKSNQDSGQEKVPLALPDVKVTDWELILVGPSQKITEEVPASDLVTLDNGMLLNQKIVNAYQALVAAAKQAGFSLVLISAYRSVSYQTEVFQGYVDEAMNQGLTEEAAIAQVKETSTEPGFSEHHTGLAFDIIDEEWNRNFTDQPLSQNFGETPGGQWLAEHAREYGFILRYPQDKESITEITYEPWHFRYVGVESAKYIEENNLSLEEYIQQLKEK